MSDQRQRQNKARKLPKHQLMHQVYQIAPNVLPSSDVGVSTGVNNPQGAVMRRIESSRLQTCGQLQNLAAL